MQDRPHSTSRTDITLADLVRRAARERAGQPALISSDATTTWGELDTMVDQTAAALRRAVPSATGPGPAPRVALALGNTTNFVVSFFAVLRAGLVAVPVNPVSTGPELRHVLADSAATLLLATDRTAELAGAVAAELPALVAVHPVRPGSPAADLGSLGDGSASVGEGSALAGGGGFAADSGSLGGSTSVADQSEAAVPRPQDDDLAVLLYTSGTEGRPRGAMLTHRALLANHEQLARIEPPVLRPDDRVLLALPLFHAYGLNSGLGAVAYHGACGVLVDRFDPVDTLDLIARAEVTVLVGVPAMFAAWAREGGPDPAAVTAATSRVRLGVCGAAALDPGTAARFAELAGCPVHVGYGLTETAPVLTSTLVGPDRKPGSIGRPLPGVELRLLGSAGEDLQESGADEPTGADTVDEPDLDFPSPGTDPGEIVVRGANLFSGYWPDGRDGPGPDGWWATRDVAYADADGDLFLVDRLGDLIIVNGFNVYPREVELVLAAHPAVAEAAVVGVAAPMIGQAIRAYVLPLPGRTVTVAELSAHCAAYLARFKCPVEWEIVTDLPRSLIGKVRRTELRSVATWQPDTGTVGPGSPGSPGSPADPAEQRRIR